MFGRKPSKTNASPTARNLLSMTEHPIENAELSPSAGETGGRGSNSLPAVPPTAAQFEFDVEDLTDNISMTSAGNANNNSTGNTGNTSESDHISSDLLKLEGKGCIGVIERLPMLVKSIFISLPAVVGLLTIAIIIIVLRSQLLQAGADTKEFVTLSKSVEKIVQVLQQERLSGGMVLLSPGNVDEQIEYMQKSSISDQQVDSLDSIFNTKYGSIDAMKSLRKQFAAAYKSLPAVRAKVLSCYQDITVLSLSDAYADVITHAISMIHSMSSVFGYTIDASLFSAYNELLEISSRIGFTGNSILLNDTFSLDRYQQLSTYNGQRALLSRVILHKASPELQAIFTAKIDQSPLKSATDRMMDEMLNGTTSFSFTAAQWFNVTQQLLELRYEVSAYFTEDIVHYAENSFNYSLAWLIALVSLAVLFGIFSIISTIFFTRTIVGPWQRLNMVQEATISKFVPKGFLSLMGWRKISDAALGKFIEKEMTILVIRIRNFKKIAASMKTPDLYEYLNNFISYIGPYVRNNKGYIDRQMNSYYIAHFQKDRSGFRAALEIQTALANFNKMNEEHQKPIVEVIISLVAGKGLIGTVGEHEHMESAVLSNNMIFAQKLQKIAKKAGAAIVTTRESINRIPKKKMVHYRYIGTFNMKHAGNVEVFELLLLHDTLKLKTRDHFSKATQSLLAGTFSEAMQLFEAIAKANPADVLAVKYRDITKKVISQNMEKLQTLTLEEVLMDIQLQTSFEEFSKQDNDSAAILSLWKAIQNFKQIDPEKRSPEAHAIFSTFLDSAAPVPVHINEALIAAVKKIIDDCPPTSSGAKTPSAAVVLHPTILSIIPSTLFNDIEDVIEANMQEALKKFKLNPSYKQAFAMSALVIRKDDLVVEDL